jgi:large subunit ribosomal protein L28
MLSSLLLRWSGSSFRRSIIIGRASVPSYVIDQSSPATATTTTSTGSTTSLVRREYGSHRARRGLYDGKDIRSGNLIPFSMKKTRRKFRPNVFFKKLYSETLDAMVRFHVTTSALRSIDKAGGLDNYILQKDFTEGEGLAHQQRIKKRLRNQAYFDRRKKKQGEDDDDTAAAAGVDTTNPDTATVTAVPSTASV